MDREETQEHCHIICSGLSEGYPDTLFITVKYTHALVTSKVTVI